MSSTGGPVTQALRAIRRAQDLGLPTAGARAAADILAEQEGVLLDLLREAEHGNPYDQETEIAGRDARLLARALPALRRAVAQARAAGLIPADYAGRTPEQLRHGLGRRWV